MKRATLVGVWMMCLSLALGCGGRADEAHEEGPGDFSIAGTTPVTVTGCLMASGDRFVLASLETAEAGDRRAATELYWLRGDEEELRGFAGQPVRVTGHAEPAQVAELVERGVGAPVGTSGRAPTGPVGTSGDEATPRREGAPQITTQAETRLETRQLQVSEITAAGGECPAMSEPGADPTAAAPMERPPAGSEAPSATGDRTQPPATYPPAP